MGGIGWRCSILVFLWREDDSGMTDPLARVCRELADLERLWTSGHPDRRGIRLAISDWMMEEVLLMETDVIVDRVERKVESLHCNCGASETFAHLGTCPAKDRSNWVKHPTFDDFCTQVRELLSNTAKAKGYNATGPEGPNMLFEFNARYFPGHRGG